MIHSTISEPHRGGDLASLLRTLREWVGLTQEELADRSGLSVRAISDLERGRTTHPQRRSVELLAKALGVDVSSLEQFRRSPHGRFAAKCPVCSATWRPGDAGLEQRSA